MDIYFVHSIWSLSQGGGMYKLPSSCVFLHTVSSKPRKCLTLSLSIWGKPRFLGIWHAIAWMMDTFYVLALLNPEKLKDIHRLLATQIFLFFKFEFEYIYIGLIFSSSCSLLIHSRLSCTFRLLEWALKIWAGDLPRRIWEEGPFSNKLTTVESWNERVAITHDFVMVNFTCQLG